MRDPYDFIDWNPYNSSQLVYNQKYVQRLSFCKEEKDQRCCDISDCQRLYLYNLVSLMILSLMILVLIRV